jgi:two-component system cell cycle response regulator
MTLASCDGEAGLAMAIQERPDLIICDVQLPKMDGQEVVRRLKADPSCRAIPIVAVTALAMVGDRDRLLKVGFDGYLTKPIDPETFVEQIQIFLGAGSSPPQTCVEDFAHEASRPAPRRGKVLVVDDLQTNLELARAVLEAFGYVVIATTSALEGLEIAVQHLPDLILSDVCMEEGSGYDFVRAVKADARLSKIPFVFISSTKVTEEDRDAALALGAKGYIVRPIDPQELLKEIEICLREDA